MNINYQLLAGKALVYGAILFSLAMAVHIYVVYPLYIKKIPYFIDAVEASFEVTCAGDRSEELKEILRYVSIPFFSLNNKVVFIGEDGEYSECWSSGGGDEEIGDFRFASLTKVLTAFAVLELSEKSDSLDLSSKLLNYIPELNVNLLRDSRVLDVDVENLLNHSSGFGGLFGSDNMVDEAEKSWCPYDLTAMNSVVLAGRPGSNYVYSNVAYCLLGVVISRVSGDDYVDYIRNNYLSDYSSLRFLDDEFGLEEPDYDYSNELNFSPNYVDWLDFDALAPAAGLVGAPEEFSKLIRDLYLKNPEILGFSQVLGCGEGEIDRCYSTTLVMHHLGNDRTLGVQQGYLPGASSLVAISSEGEVLVLVSAGAPLEKRYRGVLENRIISLFLE